MDEVVAEGEEGGEERILALSCLPKSASRSANMPLASSSLMSIFMCSSSNDTWPSMTSRTGTLPASGIVTELDECSAGFSPSATSPRCFASACGSATTAISSLMSLMLPISDWPTISPPMSQLIGSPQICGGEGRSRPVNAPPSISSSAIMDTSPNERFTPLVVCLLLCLFGAWTDPATSPKENITSSSPLSSSCPSTLWKAAGLACLAVPAAVPARTTSDIEETSFLCMW